jgi:hypothetical protein
LLNQITGMLQAKRGSSPLKHPRAKALLQAVLDAYQSIQVAKVNYDDALVIAADLESRADGELVIQQEGRKYRAAVEHYCDAVTAWLRFMDTFQEKLSERVWNTHEVIGVGH